MISDDLQFIVPCGLLVFIVCVMLILTCLFFTKFKTNRIQDANNNAKGDSRPEDARKNSRSNLLQDASSIQVISEHQRAHQSIDTNVSNFTVTTGNGRSDDTSIATTTVDMEGADCQHKFVAKPSLCPTTMTTVDMGSEDYENKSLPKHSLSD